MGQIAALPALSHSADSSACEPCRLPESHLGREVGVGSGSAASTLLNFTLHPQLHPLQLAWLALTQPQAVALSGLPSVLGGAGGGAAAGGGLGGMDPLRPLALMPDIQVGDHCEEHGMTRSTYIVLRNLHRLAVLVLGASWCVRLIPQAIL